MTTTGTRYPTLGFYTSGAAAVQPGYGPHPYETFAFDAALTDAQIQDFNILPYSSVLPLAVKFADIDQVAPQFTHGAVLESILAQIGITYGTQDNPGKVGIRRHGRDSKIDQPGAVMAAASNVAMLTGATTTSGEVVGGYVVEYVNYFPTHVGADYAQAQSEQQLSQALKLLLQRRQLDPDKGQITMENVAYIEVTEALPHGFTLSGYGFLNFDTASPVTE